MVELRTSKREMKGYGGDHHEKLGLKRIWCASHFMIPDTTVTSPNPVLNCLDTLSSRPNQACRTPDFAYQLTSSTSFSSSSPISLFRVHNSTIITEQKVKSSLAISLCHNPELTLTTLYPEYSIHRVQYTRSTAYTEYSLHRVQHSLKIVCLPFILMLPSWPLNGASASIMPAYRIHHHLPALHDSSKEQSHCHTSMVAS